MKAFRLTYLTRGDHETVGLGRELGELLDEGDAVALAGDLGSGKTWFTKGLALGLAVPSHVVVTSPSFALLNAYEGRVTLYHIDAYRLEDLADFLSAGLDEYFYEGGVVAMEWGDRWPGVLPPWALTVRFEIVDENSRKLILSADHYRSVDILKRLEEKVGEGLEA